MALSMGMRHGSYEILSAIGAGGMGEVYRARDTSLKRDVALKILPESFATDFERLARFQREAEVLASLNHPNIAAIYGLEHANGVKALVMELVEGEDLAERIARGPIPLDEALPIARQIAEALDAAHEHGIIHRDLKPANIKVRPDGTVKVLDFGLAKALELMSVVGADAMVSPTITSPAMMTGVGVLLGTAAYMSPEQARGNAVDKRADIWAFGCVLFELLTGRRAFEGATIAETLARVLEREPDWSALAADTAPVIRRLLRRCLQKDLKRRLRDIADAGLEIEELIAERPQDNAAQKPAEVAHRRRWHTEASVAAVSVVAGLAVGAILWRAPSPGLQVTRTILDVTPAEDVGTGSVLGILPGGSSTALAWSPDGRILAFVGLGGGVRRILVRDLDSDTARSLDGTEGAQSFTFSPDGRWIAFSLAFSGNQEIRKVRIGGGPPTKICDAPRLMPYFPNRVSGISWGSTRIVYTAGHQLFAVSPDGGEPLTLYESKFRVSSPFLLPDDAAVFYTEYEKYWTSGDERVVVLPLTPAAAPKVLERGAADAKYLMTGHLAFLRQGTVFVVPFSAESLEIRGGEAAVLKGVAQAVASWSAGDLTLSGQFAFSPQGALAYVASPILSLPAAELVTVNRRGQVMSLGGPSAAYRGHIESSPDGASVAVPRQTTKDVTLLLYDLVRKVTSPATQSEVGEVFSPSWSADGKIAMSVSHGGVTELALFRPDSQALPQVVSDSGAFFATSWSHDGKRLVGTKAGDVWVYSSNSELTKWTQLTRTQSSETFPVWSPDDRWLAYVSNATGSNQVYVQAYPAPGTAIPVSINGGVAPAWNPKGKELFYVEGRMGPLVDADQRMMSVDMATPTHPGKPVFLFSFSPASVPLAMCDPTPCYSVAPNGQEFFAVRMLPRQPARVTQIRLVFNWFEELKRLVPTK